MDTFDPVKLGPCSVQYGDVLIDLTKGGVTLHVEPIYKEIKVDQYGDSVADHRIIGWIVKAIVPMAKTDYNSLAGVATFMEQGVNGLTDRKLGSSMRHNAKPLTLHPLENAEGDTSEDVQFFLSSPITPIELQYGFEDARVYNVEFLAYPKANAVLSEPGNYFNIGDGAPETVYEATFTVTNVVGGDEIENAEISLAGFNATRFTDSNGQAVFHLPNGDYVYAVKRSTFDTAIGSFTVASVDEAIPVALTAST